MAKRKKTKPKSRQPAKPKPSALDQLERRLAADALRKIQLNQVPSSKETAALRRVKAADEEQKRWEFYGSIPKKHFREMSGRQTKQLHEQAERYGMRGIGRTIALPEFVKWVYDFLAKHAYKLSSEDDPMMGGGNSPALEEYRRERTKLVRLERLEREGVLVHLANIHEEIIASAGIIRSAGEQLERKFGPEAKFILDQAIDNAEARINNLLDDGPDEHDSGNSSDDPDVHT